MNHFLSIALLFVLFSSSVKGQTLFIEGNSFSVELNEQDLTATIYDLKYVIDDRQYPLSKKERKFKNLNQFKSSKGMRSNIVVIPEVYKSNNGKEYVITTIGKAAFAGYQNVDYFIIPKTIRTIDDYAFFRTSIIGIEIPPSVQNMGERVFGYCEKLKELKLPQGLANDANSYRESKDIEVKYYLVTNNDKPSSSPTSSKQTASIAPKKIEFATSSDVDENLPVTSQKDEEMFAIVIANENYQNVAKVDCALRDGRTFKAYCEQVIGIPSSNIHIVEDATYGQMVEQINWLTRIAKVYEGDAKIIVYYAGHGIPNESDGSAYLLPVDVSGNNTAAAYSLNSLYKTLGELNAKKVTVFMDACFSGSRRGDGMLMSARGVAIKVKSETPIGNMVVFSASQGDETAYPYAEKGHGLFTYYLLKKLQETKGDVDYGTLSDYLHKEVCRKSIVVNNKPQTPTVSFSSKMSSTWQTMRLK